MTQLSTRTHNEDPKLRNSVASHALPAIVPKNMLSQQVRLIAGSARADRACLPSIDDTARIAKPRIPALARELWGDRVFESVQHHVHERSDAFAAAFI